VATTASDDGVGVAGLDAVRRKTVLRREEKEPARARPCVGRSPAAFERREHGVAVDGVGGRRAARLAEVRERCESRVVKRLARVPEEAVDLGVRRENVLATLAAAHSAQHVGLAALLVQG
jgi:hypothetical protein